MKLAAEQRAQRHAEQRALATIARDPVLEAHCRASPDDPAPWAVYADWLIEHGDPRGEIAALHLRGNAGRAAELLAVHHATLCPIDPRYVTFELRHGFAIGATLKLALYEDTTDLTTATETLLASPMADLLERLRLGLAAFGHGNNWRPAFERIAHSAVADRLRVLRFDAYDYDDCMMHWIEDADFSGLWHCFPVLEELRLRGDRMTVGTLDLPRLRTYIREATALGPGEIEAITDRARPALAHLELWLGGCEADFVDSLQPIFDARGLPALRHLGLVNTNVIDLVIPRLAGSAVLPQLESLDLRMSTMGRHSAAQLVEHAAAFRHLASIDLSQNQLSDDEVAAIRRVLDNVITVDQRDIYDDEEDVEDPNLERHRYAAEYE